MAKQFLKKRRHCATESRGNDSKGTHTLNITPVLQWLPAAAAILAIVGWARIAWLERRRNGQLRARVLEATRRLARCDFGYAIEARGASELAEIAHAFDVAAANLRRQAQKSTALLDLDRALLRGVGLEPVMSELLSAAAAALQCRSVSIVLLDSASPHRARSFDFLAGAGETAPRHVTIDTQQLRDAPLGARELDVSAVGVDTEDFLAPLTRSGAQAFRLCPLECQSQVAGFLCVGFRVDTHDNNEGDIGASEIAERISLAISARGLRPAMPAAATGVTPVVGTARSPLETGLYRALQREEFTLVYQPIITAHSRQVVAVEALVRWPQGSDGATRDAAEFIPVAEQSGLIVDLGDWVLRTACLQFDRWRRDGIDLDYISVNVSARQLRHAGLLPTVLACLQRSGMQGSQLQIEITEGVLDGAPEPLAALRELARHGVHLALDDIDAGDASLDALKDLPLDTIKINRSSVAAMGEDATMRAFVQAAISMGAATHRRVIATGVERQDQLAFLEAARCDAMQGYLFAAPLVAADLPGYLRKLMEPVRLVA
jgi:EAL domain-containing protein (putative c-di-GMP-specific phosphodiesterase class I)